jgi:O-succinylbenzoic acid--CoA ligase
MDIDFDQFWRQNAQETAILFGRNRITYDDLCHAVINKIAEFNKTGIDIHERVALSGISIPEFVISLLACLHLGIIAVPLSYRYSTSQTKDILSRLNIRAILTNVKKDQIDNSRDIQQIDFGEVDVTAPLIQLPTIPSTRAATILMTSGSSGDPKAVLHTMANHYYNAQGAFENMPLQPDDRWLIALPVFHISGLAIIFRTLLSGATMVLPEEGQSLADEIKSHAVSHISLVPTQLKHLINHNADFSSIKVVLLGGAAIPPGLIRAAIQRRIPVFASYGSTEMASQVATSSVGAAKAGIRILKHRQVNISHDDEIMVRGATLSPGYISGNQIIPIFDEDGWFHTGDLGRFDRNGDLIIIGRKDTMFISGGENIFPEEIEGHLLSHTDIEQAMVVAVPDEEFGERPVAFVLTTPERDLNKVALTKFLRDKMEGFKIPDEFLPWPQGRKRLKNQRQTFKQIAVNYRGK